MNLGIIKHKGFGDAKLYKRIEQKEIIYGENFNLGVYGTLQC